MKKNIFKGVMLIAMACLVVFVATSCSKKCTCSDTYGNAQIIDPEYYGVKSCSSLESTLTAQTSAVIDCKNS